MSEGDEPTQLLLQTVPGLVDLLVDDLQPVDGVRVVRRWSDAVLVEQTGPLAVLGVVPMFATAAAWTGARASDDDVASRTVEAMQRVVERDRDEGLVLPRPELRFRVADIGSARWDVRDALVRAGFVNSTGDWDVNVETYDDVVVITLGAMHVTKRFGQLERIPASTTPVLSAGLARLAKIRPGAVVLDPFCGAGTNLVTVHQRCADVTLVGVDTKVNAVRACADNIVRRGLPATVVQSSASRLPLADQSIDRVVTNMPFGKRVGSHDINVELYPAFLRELGRVLRNAGRAVLLTEDKRLFVDSVQRSSGLKVVRELQVEIGGLHPSAYVVERSRKHRGRPAAGGTTP